MIDHLHFAHPLWLLGALCIPLVWIAFLNFYRSTNPHHQLQAFIDAHLLPYLLKGEDKGGSLWKPLLVWSLVWLCLTVALAGPRWNFREVDGMGIDSNLVIVLDLSESMNATDVKPSRLIRAKQKIEDLMHHSKGVKIGLIGFAADPHMIAPLTEDRSALKHLLPSIGTDLVYVQGSRLSQALNMASAMLQNEPGSNKTILVISDGGFEDSSAIALAKTLGGMGMVIHTMGVGTLEGAPLEIAAKGVLSKLEKDRLEEVSRVGKGRYFAADYSDTLEAALSKETKAESQKKYPIWDEGFYWLILPTLPFFLWWFRRGYVLVALFLFLIPNLHADLFKTSEQLGKVAFDLGEYEEASHLFSDPYRKGVACYKAGKYAEAEKWFHVSGATYNWGNALALQEKFKEAIAAYEDVLKDNPDHIAAKDNLELIRKLLEEQKQDSSSSNEDSDESPQDNQNEQQEDSSQEERQEKEEKAEGQQENSPQEEQQEKEEKSENQQGDSSQEEQPEKEEKSEEEQNADLWLNQLSNDPKPFLKNKFYLESKKNGTKEGIDPW